MRRTAIVATLAVLVAGCGVLPGTGDNGTQVILAEPTLPAASPTPIEFETGEPTPTPSVGPAPTEVPTATPIPEPTPTPSVDDSYTTFLETLRRIFAAADKEAAIGEVIPLPVDLFLPDDAVLEELEVGYGRWDLWGDITGRFPPIDTAAQVTLSISMSTSADIDEIADAYRVAFREAGFVEASDNSLEGQFSDVSYELNGGLFSRGRDGEGRVNILRQGETNFLVVDMSVELAQDSRPPIIEWPSVFPMPFSGNFYQFGATVVPGADGISISSRAQWIIGGQVSDVGGLLETMAEEYPAPTISLGETISAPASGDTATATFQHLIGSAGTIQATVTTDGTLVEIVSTSLPG